MQLTNEMKVALKSFLFEALKTPNSKVIAIIQKILSQKETHSAEITIAVEALKTIQKNIKAEKEESEDLINSLLANCAQRGIGYNDNEKKLAYELCKAASEKQYPLAQYVMARCLRFKNGCVQSVTESVKYYIAAAKKNIVCAQTELALIFEKSNLKEVPKDPVKAEKLRKIAIQQTQLMESAINKLNAGKLHAELFLALEDGTFIDKILNSQPKNVKLKLLRTVIESKREAELISMFKDESHSLNNNKKTLLHYVCAIRDNSGKFQLNEVDDICLSILKYLFEQGLGSEIDAQDHRGETCLHHTVSNNFIETTRFLLTQKAKTEIINYWGQTPLETTYHDGRFEPHMQLFYETVERTYIPIRNLLKEFGAKELTIPSLYFPPLPPNVLEELTEEYQLKSKQIVKLTEKEEKKLAEDSAVVEEIMQKRQILEFTCKTEIEIKTIKEKHPNAFYFIQPPRKEFKEFEYKVAVYYDLTEAEKKTIASLQPHTRSVIHKNRLGFELLHHTMGSLDSYLEKFPTLTQKVLDKTIDFVDLTRATDYRFFVNTIITKPQQLKELIAGDPKFFDFAPFVSVCLLDKGTRGFGGEHQANHLFPAYLALEVPVEAIDYLGPTDIGSPYNCDSTTKIKYLKRTESTRITMDWRQAQYQLKGLSRPSNGCLPDSPYVVRNSLEADPKYKNPDYRYLGSLPLYTAEGLLRDTNRDPQHDNSYNEAIIKGNAFLVKRKIRAKLLLVEKYFLEKFNKDAVEYKMTSEAEKQQAESLELLAQLPKLTKGRIKLALIDTDMLAFRRKHPLLKQLQILESEKPILNKKWIRRAKQLERLKMNGQVVPKAIEEEVRVLKEKIDIWAKEQAEIIGLAYNPPLLALSRRKNLNFANATAANIGGTAATTNFATATASAAANTTSNYSQSQANNKDFKSKK